jgi:Arc/MetJ family transcription regulator
MVEVDDEALARPAAELGTTTKKDTINAALRWIASRRDRAARVGGQVSRSSERAGGPGGEGD